MFRSASSPTRFASLPRGQARLLLAGFGAGILVLIWWSFRPVASPPAEPGGPGDIETYRHVVEALQRGMEYYTALHAELLRAGFATLSIFNWRPPFFLSAVAAAPFPLAPQLVLGAIAAIAAALCLSLVESLAQRVVLAVLLVLGLASVFAPGVQYLSEVYAGGLILLSAAAYARGLTWVGLPAAILALFCRELAILYALVCVILALRERRWRELAAWTAALLAYAAYFAWHATTVLSLLGPLDRADPEGWVRFGGLGFVLATAQFNGAFLLLPPWITALLLPLALLGLGGWRRGARAALAVFAYLVAYAIIGKPANAYWGALYTPLLGLGAAWAIPALRDLLRAAR